MRTPTVARLMLFFLLGVSVILNSHLVSHAQNASCFAPGIQVLTDTADPLVLPFHDIENVHVAEPFYWDGSQKLAFSLKVEGLRPDLPVLSLPLGTWNVIFTNSSGTSRFVQMSTMLGSPEFRYGTVTDLLGVPIFNVQGNIQGNYEADGRVTMYVAKSLVGNPATGTSLAISARTYVNTVGIGLVQIDDSGSSNYEVQGTGSCAPFMFASWGMNGDIPVANDYNRNGTADFAIWRPNTGEWYAIDSLTGAMHYAVNGSGNSGDIPVVGDYDNDTRGDFAVYRPQDGDWHIRRSETGETSVTHFGAEGDIPLSGDFDGDRVGDIVVWRPSTRVFYVLNSLDSSVRIVQFGLSEDRPVRGDFDGDRRSDIALFRPSNGVWYMLMSSNDAFAGVNWGLGTDVVVPEDYDGDGKTDFAIFRPETGWWYILRSNDGGLEYGQWGIGTDIVQPADYNGNGRADFAVFRPSGGEWYVHFR